MAPTSRSITVCRSDTGEPSQICKELLAIVGSQRVEMKEPGMPPERSRIVPPGTRVADKVLQTFDYACIMQDYDTAAALLVVLEDIAELKARRFGGDRRSSGPALAEARERLAGLKRGTPWHARDDDGDRAAPGD